MKKSKIPEELKRLLIKRKEAGEKLLSLEAQVNQKLEELDLTNIQEFADFQDECGCMVFTEPINYYGNTIKFLERHL